MRQHLLVLVIVASSIASPARPAQPVAGVGPWARFEARDSLDAVRPIVASDVPGGAALSGLSVDDRMLLVDGTLGLVQDSRWSTLGAEVAPATAGAGADMTGASVLRIRLASALARPLRVRIKGGDSQIGSSGCYPIVVQMVATVPADYVIPLSAFHSPGWCGARTTSIEQTLKAVQRVEVTANDEPAGAVNFRVGGIDFLPDDWIEPDPAWHLAWSDDFDGERGGSVTQVGWLVDDGSERGATLDGLGHLRLRAGADPAAGPQRVAIRTAQTRPIRYGRTEIRLRVPEAADGERPPSVRVALQASSTDAVAIVLLEGNAGAEGFAAGLDGPGPRAAAFKMRVRVPSPLQGHFVTVACDRERDRIRWLVDGVLVQEIGRGDLPAAAWSALEQGSLVLAISIDDVGSKGAAAREAPLLVDAVRSWQLEEPVGALAVAQRASAARRRVASAGPAASAAPTSGAASSRRVVCEFSARYQLMLCY